MKLIGTILLKYLKWILPVMLLDGCFNRDPYLKIDERFSLSAISGGSPKSLINRDPEYRSKWDSIHNLKGAELEKTRDELHETSSWQLHEVADYKLADEAIIGRSERGYFIADRQDGRLHLFPEKAERDRILREQYHLDPKTSFHPPREWMWMRSRLFWPWVELYYLCCLVVIPWRQVGARILAAKKLYEFPSL